MNNQLSFIWDLDGTLLDSYEIIVSSLQNTYKNFGVELKTQDILDYVIKYSVSSFISKMNDEYGIDFNLSKEMYSKISGEQKLNINLIENAREILEYIHANGIKNFVFTHRGKTTFSVLENTKILNFFEKIITSEDGFPRKPDGTAVEHLIKEFNLTPDKSFYVGDRNIDMQCAANAGIKSIMYVPTNSVAKPSGYEKYLIHDLLEIKDIIAKEQ